MENHTYKIFPKRIAIVTQPINTYKISVYGEQCGTDIGDKFILEYFFVCFTRFRIGQEGRCFGLFDLLSCRFDIFVKLVHFIKMEFFLSIISLCFISFSLRLLSALRFFSSALAFSLSASSCNFNKFWILRASFAFSFLSSVSSLSPQVPQIQT